MFSQNSIGVDIQQERISIGWIQSSINGLSLSAFETCEHDKENKEGTLFHVDELITRFIDKHSIKTFDLYIGISERNCLIKSIEVPLSVRDEIDSLLGYEIEKYVPIPASKIIFDYRILKEDKSKDTLDILLQAFKKDDLAPFIGLKDFIPGGITGIMLTESAIEEYEYFRTSKRKFQIRGVDSQADDYFQKLRPLALGFQKFNPDRGRINFLPQRFRKQPSRLPLLIFISFIALNIIALFAMGASYLIQNSVQNSQLDGRLSQLKEKLVKVETLEKRVGSLEAREMEVRGIFQNRPSMLEILTELTRIMPPDTHLKEFDFKKNTIWIKGYSNQASRLIKIFESSGLFTNAEFETKITIEKDHEETFIIKMRLEKQNES